MGKNREMEAKRKHLKKLEDEAKAIQDAMESDGAAFNLELRQLIEEADDLKRQADLESNASKRAQLEELRLKKLENLKKNLKQNKLKKRKNKINRKNCLKKLGSKMNWKKNSFIWKDKNKKMNLN